MRHTNVHCAHCASCKCSRNFSNSAALTAAQVRQSRESWLPDGIYFYQDIIQYTWEVRRTESVFDFECERIIVAVNIAAVDGFDMWCEWYGNAGHWWCSYFPVRTLKFQLNGKVHYIAFITITESCKMRAVKQQQRTKSLYWNYWHFCVLCSL